MKNKILIVDDDSLVLKTLTNLLSKAGYSSDAAESADEAYRKVKSTSFDLIISDIRMPGEDGLSFLNRLKNEIWKKNGCEVPFVFITGYADEDAPMEALKLGAKDYLLKPFNLEELLVCIKKHICPANDAKKSIRFFPLLIDGQFIDTGKYKYLAHVDSSLKDPIGTLRALKEFANNDSKAISSENEASVVIAKYCICSDEHIDAAILAAHRASKIFLDFSFARRVKILNGIYELLMSEKKELVNLMVAEGHPEELSIWEFSGMEMAYRPESINFYKEQLRGSYGQLGTETMGWVRKPDGVVVVSPPGNAPCSNSLTAGFALLGGNSLVVKPPLRMPISTMYLWHEVIWKVLRIFNAPAGTVNTVVGNSKVITDKWMESPLVNDVFFFGDSATGIEIGSRAYAAGKKPILELSGNDFLGVWKDADLKQAADSMADCFIGSTQICMVPKKAIIHEDVYLKFETEFLERAGKIKAGLPSEKGVCLTPVVRTDDFFEFLEDAKTHGAEVLCGGNRINHKNEIDPKGMFLQPTVLRIADWQKALQMKCVQEENFFPLIPLIKVSASSENEKDEQIFDRMIHIVNSNKYGLRASVWVKSDPYIAKFVKKLDRCGLLRVNSRHAGFSPYLTTHGGSGLSGGPFGEANYVWQKTTHLQSVSIVRS
jgi:acyl-CoA reductase-like NAD-dependent aldehyde dehydrogenase/ActR/RegA family two-component response regulator